VRASSVGPHTDDIDELRARFESGEWTAATRLPVLLAEQDRIDEAIAVLRGQLNAGHVLGSGDPAVHLAGLLVSQGKLDEAEPVMRLGLAADGETLDGC
jgi:hypothetical protein